jgi:hypothetical protein
MKKAQILKSYNEKVRHLRIKGQEISELIGKAKIEGAHDRGLLEILSKWEEANQKLFENPLPDNEGEGDEFSLLEVAH